MDNTTNRRDFLKLIGSSALAAAAPLDFSRVLAIPAHNRTGTIADVEHIVILMQENVSFDHYFGTYPAAANTSGQTFAAEPATPAINGLNNTLLTRNPNGSNPRRLDPANVNDILTCDQDHDYTDEQV